MSMHTLLTIAFALSMGAIWIACPVIFFEIGRAHV